MRQRELFWFWLPLCASWALMTAEGPLISAAINRLPDAVLMLAAFGIVVGLEVALESPIINLLATSTAKVRDRRSYRLVRRFTVHWMVVLTVVSALLAWTPLFDLVVVQAMGTPAEVHRWVRPGLGIMVPWSAAIAWRRFLQGVLIGRGRTAPVSLGTALRLVVSGGTAIGLAVLADLPGVILGAFALVVGVLAEALFVTWIVRPVIARELPEELPETAELTYRELFGFHLPLASTSVLTLLIQPLVTGFLARLDRPVESLAAWPIIFQFMLLMRAMAFALPEVVIAKWSKPGARRALERFSWWLAAGSGAAMLLFATTPLAMFYLTQVQSAPPGIVGLARQGFFWLIPLPAIATLTSWGRGRLIGAGTPGVVNEAMVARVVTTVLLLAVGLWWRAPGIAMASATIVLANLAELAWLASRTPRELSDGG